MTNVNKEISFLLSKSMSDREFSVSTIIVVSARYWLPGKLCKSTLSSWLLSSSVRSSFAFSGGKITVFRFSCLYSFSICRFKGQCKKLGRIKNKNQNYNFWLWKLLYLPWISHVALVYYYHNKKYTFLLLRISRFGVSLTIHKSQTTRK